MFVRFLLVLGVIAIGTVGFIVSDLPLKVQTSTQQQIRKLKERSWENEPIKVVAVTGKGERPIALGESQLADDDWLQDLTISVKNTSTKNILFIELELHFLRPLGSSTPVVAYPIIFGTPPRLINASSSMLAPNENWRASLSNQEYGSISEQLNRAGYVAGGKEVEIITREVVFADRTTWSAGRNHLSTESKKSNSQVPLLSVKKKVVKQSSIQ